tara:strand:- start:215 stop:406 length:192 start_codon:yes stop_codon:yes gene_type:complete
MKVPAWQEPLYQASIRVASLLDEIDYQLGDGETNDTLYKQVSVLQHYITKLETILYKEKHNGF